MRMSSRNYASAVGKLLFVAAFTSVLLAIGCGSGYGSGTTPISVTITNKISTIAAGAAATTLNATVQYDSTNSGVTWSLKAGGTDCSPTCGSLSGATSTSVTYTPPATAPTGAPTITATSVKDATKSDADGFTITGPAISVTITNKVTTALTNNGTITFNATVQNDPPNKGVTWTLMEIDGTTCPIGCGLISNATATSVTYTPPTSPFGGVFDTPIIKATSISDATKFDQDNFTIVETTVTISNKVNDVTAGSGPITFKAVVTNDPSNSGVIWGLSENGGLTCDASCGMLGTTTSTTVVYNPPAAPLAFPNTVNIAATSVRDLTRADAGTFGIISGTVSSCTGTPTGLESLLSGQYTFFAQGQAEMGASFAADGKGHFTDLGGGVAGNMDFNGGLPESLTVIPTSAGGGFYTVGADPAGVGDVGCLSLYTSDGSTRIFRFALGEVSGGVATAGRITEYDDQIGIVVGTPARVSGPLRRQDPMAFASGDTSRLQPNYAFGVGGTDASVVGGFVLNPASGAITSSEFDSDEGGTLQTDVQGSTGSIASVSAKTGRALFTFTPKNANWPGFITQTQAAVYIVNPNEFFLVGIDPPPLCIGGCPPYFSYSGRAVVSGTGFSSSSLSGNFIIHQAGGSTPVNFATRGDVSLWLLSFNGVNVTGTIFEYNTQGGATTTTVANESYSVGATFGRVVLTGTGLTKPPVLYLAKPSANTETINAFSCGTDTVTGSGVVEPGASNNIMTGSLAGNYFFGDEFDSGDETTTNPAGVLGISNAGALSGTKFSSGPAPGLLATTSVSGSVTIDNAKGPGTGNIGPNSVAITNGTKLFFIDESAGTPASITVVEHQ